jgi:hypothetical protein
MAQLKLTTGPAASTPDPGQVAVYAKTDGFLYTKDDAGTETGPLGVGGATQLGTKFNLRTGDAYVIPADYQYIVKAPGLIVDPGASFTLSPGAQLMVIP